MRGWINEGRSYLPPVEIGAPMRANGLGTILASKAEGFKAGDKVRRDSRRMVQALLTMGLGAWPFELARVLRRFH